MGFHQQEILDARYVLVEAIKDAREQVTCNLGAELEELIEVDATLVVLEHLGQELVDVFHILLLLVHLLGSCQVV